MGTRAQPNSSKRPSVSTPRNAAGTCTHEPQQPRHAQTLEVRLALAVLHNSTSRWLPYIICHANTHAGNLSPGPAPCKSMQQQPVKLRLHSNGAVAHTCCSVNWITGSLPDDCAARMRSLSAMPSSYLTCIHGTITNLDPAGAAQQWTCLLAPMLCKHDASK